MYATLGSNDGVGTADDSAYCHALNHIVHAEPARKSMRTTCAAKEERCAGAVEGGMG